MATCWVDSCKSLWSVINRAVRLLSDDLACQVSLERQFFGLSQDAPGLGDSFRFCDILGLGEKLSSVFECVNSAAFNKIIEGNVHVDNDGEHPGESSRAARIHWYCERVRSRCDVVTK